MSRICGGNPVEKFIALHMLDQRPVKFHRYQCLLSFIVAIIRLFNHTIGILIKAYIFHKLSIIAMYTRITYNIAPKI